MAQSGPLWRKRDCSTEMNVVYKFASCSALLPDNSSHHPLNFILEFLEAATSLTDQIIGDIFIRFLFFFPTLNCGEGQQLPRLCPIILHPFIDLLPHM